MLPGWPRARTSRGGTVDQVREEAVGLSVKDEPKWKGRHRRQRTLQRQTGFGVLVSFGHGACHASLCSDSHGDLAFSSLPSPFPSSLGVRFSGWPLASAPACSEDTLGRTLTAVSLPRRQARGQGTETQGHRLQTAAAGRSLDNPVVLYSPLFCR